MPLGMMTTIVDALRADKSLATSVKYLHTVLCPWIRADSRPLKDRDDAFPVASRSSRAQ